MRHQWGCARTQCCMSICGLGADSVRYALAGIQDLDRSASLSELKRASVGRIVVGGDHDVLTRPNRKTIKVNASCICRHDAGPVVVAKSHVTLQRPGCEHGVSGAQCPAALPRHPRRRFSQVICYTLQQAGNTSIVKAERCGADHNAYTDIFECFDLLCKIICCLRLSQCISTQYSFLLNQDHIKAGFRSG